MSSYCTINNTEPSAFLKVEGRQITSAQWVSCAFAASAISQQTPPDFRGQTIAAGSLSPYSTAEQTLGVQSWAC